MTSVVSSYNILNKLSVEIILQIFNKFTDIKDIINFAMSNDNIKEIYKAHLNNIIKNLIQNNKKNRMYISFLINICYNKKETIEKRVYLINLIANFLSNNSYEDIINNIVSFRSYLYNNNQINSIQRLGTYYKQRIFFNFNHICAMKASGFNQHQFKKLLDLIKMGYEFNECLWIVSNLNDDKINMMMRIISNGIDISDAKKAADILEEEQLVHFYDLIQQNFTASDAIFIIENLNEANIISMNALIEQGVSKDFAPHAVFTFNEHQLELFKTLINYEIGNYIQWRLIEDNVEEEFMNIMIRLIENGIEDEIAFNIACELLDSNNYNESILDRCINYIQMGVGGQTIFDIFQNNISDNDINIMFQLMERNINSDTAIKIILNNKSEEDINKIIELIHENPELNHEIAFYLIDKNYSKELIDKIKIYFNDINIYEAIYLINHFTEELDEYIKRMLQIGIKMECIMKLLHSLYLYLPFDRINLQFMNDIIIRLEQIISFGVEHDFAMTFIIEFEKECKKRTELRISNLHNINFYNSEAMVAALNLIRNGFNIFMTNYIIFTLGKNYMNIINHIFNTNEEMSKIIAKNFDKIQLDILVHLIKEGCEIDRAFRFVMDTNKNKLDKIYNIASTGETYTRAMNHIMDL